MTNQQYKLKLAQKAGFSSMKTIKCKQHLLN